MTATQPYARALDLLQRKCSNPRERLGDFAVFTVRTAKESNVKTNIINVLRNVRGSIPAGWPRRGCSEIFAAYLTILTS